MLLIIRQPVDNVQEEIAKLEAQYDIKLPPQYREFLVKYNGGCTLRGSFEVKRESSSLRAFFGVGDNVLYSFKNNLNWIYRPDLEEWVGQGIFPIAKDSWGNYILVGISEEKKDKIYFWVHDDGRETRYLCEDLKTFTEYCSSEKEEGILKIPSIEEREAMMLARGKKVTAKTREHWQEEIDELDGALLERVIL